MITYKQLHYHNSHYPISSRICRLFLCRGLRPSPNECPGYDTKLSDGEALVLELSGM